MRQSAHPIDYPDDMPESPIYIYIFDLLLLE